METKNKPLPAKEMHKIVWACVGVLTLCFVTYPIAMFRVTQKEKFRGIYVKSLTMELKKPDGTTADVKAADKPVQSAIASSGALPAVVADSQKSLPEKSPNVLPFTNQSSEPAIASSGTNQTVQAVPVSAGKLEAQAVNVTNRTAEISDRAKLQELSLKLYDRINQGWQTSPTFTQNLVYRVSASLDGAIANFEPLNQPAKDFTQETPLPNLQKSSQTQSNSNRVPAAQFTVVFAPSGVLEVNP
ncbi:hypothetical protein [Microcoleus sp. herbarium12]|jgi:hypothetical protein|uniref:hypothetical protein n=1 Tax=Microcoleus sp. herbarium12 TaxID=3055437 RepID=UPI002FD02FE7